MTHYNARSAAPDTTALTDAVQGATRMLGGYRPGYVRGDLATILHDLMDVVRAAEARSMDAESSAHTATARAVELEAELALSRAWLADDPSYPAWPEAD